VILLDTGPIVALFDPKDDAHVEARRMLRGLRGPLVTTTPVLTEAFHLLDPGSQGATALRAFLQRDGAVLWFMEIASLTRALELMERYADHPMDFADASLVTAAEQLRTTQIFTLDQNDFSSYRARIGRSHRGFKVLSP
jgi:predicted nucleic acid-binding protein